MMYIYLSALGMTSSLQLAMVPQPSEVSKMRKARDPSVAVQEELCVARAAGTLAAYDLFIARHPKHPLANTARTERAALEVAGKR